MRLALIIILLASLAGCSHKAPAAANLRNHRNEIAGFALNLPQGWIVTSAANDRESYLRVLPAEDKKPAVRLMISVLVETAPKGLDLAAYFKSAREQFARLPGYSEHQALLIQHPSGQPAYLIDADAAQSDASDKPHRFKQYAFLLHGRQIVLTAVVPAEDGDRWMAEVDPILASFLIW
jgi:hypothetical protein